MTACGKCVGSLLVVARALRNITCAGHIAAIENRFG
jgi:hypothetical protein